MTGFVYTGLFAQTSEADGGALAAENTAQLDAAVQSLAAQVAARLDILDEGSRVGIENFPVDDSSSSLGVYWKNQILNSLVERTNRKFILDGGSGTGASPAFIVSGEIVFLGNTIRVYTRLNSIRESSLLAAWTTDLRKSSYLDELAEGTRPSSSSSSGGGSVRRDSFEEDSADNPVEAGVGTWISRTLHPDDEDWFLFRPAAAGPYVFETSGNTDTFIELYDAGDLSQITENDDGGDNYNACISFSAENGKSYLIKTKGYSSDDTGPYRFRARAGE
ncbi:MAG: hypothetical protein LBG42_03550 [Treponema sp.]|nr:hypothetical protein [Treponema sp.]